MVLQQFSKAFTARETSNPKTVLAFYAGVLVILGGTAIGAVAVLASTKLDLWLIPWCLLAAAIFFVGLVVVVVVINIKDPSKLMLTKVTGKEYAEIQRYTIGDSLMGEQTVIAGQVPKSYHLQPPLTLVKRHKQ